MSEHQFRGMVHDDEGQQADAPEMPTRLRALAESDPPRVARGTGTYPTVRFKGRYGIACNQYQEFERHGITRKEAHEIAWNFFGVCGKTIVYLDRDGNVLFEE